MGWRCPLCGRIEPRLVSLIVLIPFVSTPTTLPLAGSLGYGFYRGFRRFPKTTGALGAVSVGTAAIFAYNVVYSDGMVSHVAAGRAAERLSGSQHVTGLPCAWLIMPAAAGTIPLHFLLSHALYTSLSFPFFPSAAIRLWRACGPRAPARHVPSGWHAQVTCTCI